MYLASCNTSQTSKETHEDCEIRTHVPNPPNPMASQIQNQKAIENFKTVQNTLQWPRQSKKSPQQRLQIHAPKELPNSLGACFRKYLLITHVIIAVLSKPIICYACSV